MSKSVPVGGQAVIEGVMMRSPNSLAVAVRRPDNEIVIKEAVWHSIWNKLPFLRWPFLRGTVVMIEAMMNGMQALNFSAREAMPEEEQQGEHAASKASASADSDKEWMQMVFPILLSVVFAIGLFKFVPHLAATYAGKLFVGKAWTVDDLSYHFVDGFVKIALFIAYVAGISFLKDIRRVFMYHGAEHKAIYTYEAGEELTVENARKKTRLHPRCGTSFLMVVILVFILVSALILPILPDWIKPSEEKPFYFHLLLVLVKLPLLIPVAGISYEFNRFAGKHCNLAIIKPLMWPGLFMQLLTTKEPTDDQLEIALVALRTSLWREQVGTSAETVSDELLVFSDFDAFQQASSNLRA
ncbi:MAG: DUF1385 domain-containing protein [Deltaproteobacteria bacterium]|nr:DUF1385 domain-containing protein [Deltaproteobacteria bacterium]MBN2673670.1 DUF1385 domain-containing protein [Deltaproteobacteria bacterium]